MSSAQAASRSGAGSLSTSSNTPSCSVCWVPAGIAEKGEMCWGRSRERGEVGERRLRRGRGLSKKQKENARRGREMQKGSSGMEEAALAGEPAEGTSQRLLKVFLPLCRGDNLEDESLAAKPVWMRVGTRLPSPLKSRGSHKATIWICSRVCQHLLLF